MQCKRALKISKREREKRDVDRMLSYKIFQCSNMWRKICSNFFKPFWIFFIYKIIKCAIFGLKEMFLYFNFFFDEFLFWMCSRMNFFREASFKKFKYRIKHGLYLHSKYDHDLVKLLLEWEFWYSKSSRKNHFDKLKFYSIVNMYINLKAGSLLATYFLNWF